MSTTSSDTEIDVSFLAPDLPDQFGHPDHLALTAYSQRPKKLTISLTEPNSLPVEVTRRQEEERELGSWVLGLEEGQWTMTKSGGRKVQDKDGKRSKQAKKTKTDKAAGKRRAMSVDESPTDTTKVVKKAKQPKTVIPIDQKIKSKVKPEEDVGRDTTKSYQIASSSKRSKKRSRLASHKLPTATVNPSSSNLVVKQCNADAAMEVAVNHERMDERSREESSDLSDAPEE